MSLEKTATQIIRTSLRTIPLGALERSSRFVRVLLGWQLRTKLVVTKPFENVEEICMLGGRDQKCNGFNGDVIYIHGGGFSLCDSSDILLSERLIAVLEEKNVRVRSVYSIIYNTLPSGIQCHAQSCVQSQVMKAFLAIMDTIPADFSVAVVGDSAGANLALGLMFALQKTTFDFSRLKLCLISPWLDLFTQSVSYELNKQNDIVDQSWLLRSRRSYLDLEIDTLLSTSLTDYNLKRSAKHFAKILNSNGIEVVVFDMDNCLVNAHSMGRLRRDRLSSFLDSVTPDFVCAAVELHRCGIKLAIATHSDSAEYGTFFRSPDTHIMGEELVNAVLSNTLPSIMETFKVVAYNPTVRRNGRPEDQNKRKHMREIARHYGVDTRRCILFDDDINNVHNNGERMVKSTVQDLLDQLRTSVNANKLNHTTKQSNSALISTNYSDSFVAYQVDARTGFRLPAAVLAMQRTPPSRYISDSHHSSLSSTQYIQNTIQRLLSQEGKDGKGHETENNFSLYGDCASERQLEAFAAFVQKEMDIKLPQRPTSPVLEMICPAYASAAQLRALPATLIVAGGRELFIDEILVFWKRLARAKDIEWTLSTENESLWSTAHKGNRTSVSLSTQLLVAPDDVHAFPILWRHPLHRVLAPLGLEWLFFLILPNRKIPLPIHKMPEGQSFTGMN